MSETTDNAAGERECSCWRLQLRRGSLPSPGCPRHSAPATPDADDASEDVEALAKVLHAAVCGDPDTSCWTEEGGTCAEVGAVGIERAILASDWLAAREAAARAEGAAEALREAREDIRARRREFSRLNADEQYLAALDDAFGLVSNRIARGESR